MNKPYCRDCTNKEITIAVQDAEISRLRKALEEIRDRYRDISECECDFYDDDGIVIFCDYHIAVKALEGKNERS